MRKMNAFLIIFGVVLSTLVIPVVNKPASEGQAVQVVDPTSNLGLDWINY